MKKRYLFFGALLLNALGLQAQFHLDNCEKGGNYTLFDGCWNHPYILVFEDEFDYSSFDTLEQRNWGKRWPEGAGLSEDVQEYNTLDNVTVNDGKATITVKYEPGLREQASGNGEYGKDGFTNLRPYVYTSASVWSNYIFGNGYFEMRCKVPTESGYWPAFWLYNGKAGWGKPELDIFEMWDNNPNDISLTIHNSNEMCTKKYHVETSDPWMKFGAYWDDWKIVWLINDFPIQVTYRWYLPPIVTPLTGITCDMMEQYPNGVDAMINYAFPTTPMQIAFNLAVRDGTPVPNPINFPAKMEVDYIRFYQQRSGCDIVETYPTTASLGLDDDADMIAYLGKPYYHNITNRVINIHGTVAIAKGKQLRLTAAEEINVNIDPVTGQPDPSSGMSWDVESGADVEVVIDPNVCSNTPHLRPMDGTIEQAPDQMMEGFENEDGTLGVIQELFKPEKASVSPNPTNQDVITLVSSERTNVIFTNTLGRKVKEVEVQAGSNQLNVQDLDSGVYQLYFESLKETIKLVKL